MKKTMCLTFLALAVLLTLQLNRAQSSGASATAEKRVDGRPESPARDFPARDFQAWDFNLFDASGEKHTAQEWKAARVVVLFFISTECPISNRYAPEFNRLVAAYAARGAIFYGVHSDSAIEAPAVRRYAHDYGFKFPMLLDPAQTLAGRTGVTLTPTAVILSPAGNLLYRGRVDNRYLDFGKYRDAGIQPDLQLALDAALAGRSIPEPLTKSVGCALPRRGHLTFSKDIAPIIFGNCVSCHHPDGGAPFSLLAYQDLKKRAKQIAYLTEKRIMPPWKASEGDYQFKDERRLTGEQIAMIRQWVEAGAPEGDPKDLPPPPATHDGWHLGRPDLIVKMSEAYQVPADGPDLYRNFVLPLNLTDGKWVKAIEFRPGVRSVVHHSLFFYDATGSARKQDEEDPLPGYRGRMGGLARGFFGNGNARRTSGNQPATVAAPIGTLGGWAVGAQASVLPEGLAWYLPANADLILSTHFHPSGKPEQEISTVGIYFADQAPTRKFMGIQLPPLFGVFKGIDIPAGAKEYTVEDSYTLPVDVKAFGVGAHAHYLGKQMKLTAHLPGGETRTLLWINDWDFAWQDQYRFKEFVSLPKGTRLDVKITYDNSADNPRNPASPPKRVRWGEGSNDEMGSMSLIVVAANESEFPQLRDALRSHVRSALMSRGGLSFLWRRAGLFGEQ